MQQDTEQQKQWQSMMEHHARMVSEVSDQIDELERRGHGNTVAVDRLQTNKLHHISEAKRFAQLLVESRKQ